MRSILIGTVTGLIAGLVVIGLGACGGSNGYGGGSPSSPSPTPPPPPSDSTPTVTITSSGVNPREVRIQVNQRVRFVNNDSRNREPASDPHPAHTDCPAINRVGVLTPGASRETDLFTREGTCRYHDHITDNVDPNFRGVILVGVSDPGEPPEY